MNNLKEIIRFKNTTGISKELPDKMDLNIYILIVQKMESEIPARHIRLINQELHDR